VSDPPGIKLRRHWTVLDLPGVAFSCGCPSVLDFDVSGMQYCRMKRNYSGMKLGRYSEAVIFALSAAIPVVMGLGYLTYHTGLSTVFDQLVVFPLRTFADYRVLP